MDDPCQSTSGARPRVLLADDHTLLLEAFSKLLEEECDVVGTVGDGESALAETRRLHPDIVVMDITMPRLDGLTAGRRLLAEMPDVKLIFLTVNDSPQLRAEALRIGASGYLLKHAAASDLIDAIQLASGGDRYVTPTRSVSQTASPSPSDEDLAAGLTARQLDVLKLIVAGCTMKQIAHNLSITPRTVAFHKYAMMESLGIATTPELVVFAIKHDLDGN